MKRSGPPQRRTPLVAKTGLSPGTGLQRGKSLAPVSRKRQGENRQRRAMADRQFGPEVPLCAWPWGPSHWADAYHEILTRARGGSITDEHNTLPMCNLHNGMLGELTGDELDRVYKAGLLVHSWGAAS